MRQPSPTDPRPWRLGETPYGPHDLPCGHWVHRFGGQYREGWHLMAHAWMPCPGQRRP